MRATLPVIIPHCILHTKCDMWLAHPLNPKLLKPFYSARFFLLCTRIIVYLQITTFLSVYILSEF
jgi:hypothetical protein